MTTPDVARRKENKNNSRYWQKKKEILLGHVWLQPHLGYFVILKSFCSTYIFLVRLCFLVLFYCIYIPSDVLFWLLMELPGII